MKYFSLIFLGLLVVCTAFGSPTDNGPHSIILRHRRQLDLYGNARRIIKELVANLRKAAAEATEAIKTFTASVQEQAVQIREKIANDIQKLRERVTSAIEDVSNKLIDSGVAVVGCVAVHRDNATALFNDTVSKALNCVDERIADANEQIQELTDIAVAASEFGNKALEDMRKCTEENGNIFTTGSCLGNVAVQTEMKALVFLAENALTMGRISLTMATLSASLEVCAGSQLVQSGMSTAKIIMEIGSCSASSIYSTFTGSSLETPESIVERLLPSIPRA